MFAKIIQIIVEDEDGEVVKKYELPSQKEEKEGGGALVSQSLKYMGMGGLVKPTERSQGTSGPSGEADSSAAAGKQGTAGMGNWAGAFGRSTGVESSAPKARKKSEAEEAEEEDDRHIRFTIGGVGQRMTKEGFIQEMRKFDKSTRSEIVEHSDAPHVVKTLAKQDARSPVSSKRSPPPGKAVAGRSADASGPARLPEASSTTTSTSGGRGLSLSSSQSPTGRPALGGGDGETAVEQRRRLAAMKTAEDAHDDMAETPAERRRREAALGMSSTAGDADSDSDDDDTPRVPPAKRGIRFVEAPKGGKRS